MASPDAPGRAIRSVYQPIVDLQDGTLVAVEALSRGEPGPWEQPAELFAQAAELGTVEVLDQFCLRAALRGVHGLPEPATVFVNIEPATLATLGPRHLTELAALVPDHVQLVLEVTERDLVERPAELVRGVRGIRELGWGVALDDVGAEPAGIALMPFLRPDVIKLDLALARGHTSLQDAGVVNAVRAEAERSGAVVLAEGIEDEQHLERALSMGARLGQGWMFGRPGALAVDGMRALPVPRQAQASAVHSAMAGDGAVRRGGMDTGAPTPYALLAAGSAPQRAPVPLLAAMTRHLENQALLLDEQTVLLANFQGPETMTPLTRRRYETLAAATALTAVTGVGMPGEPAPGVHGTALEADDPLADEWVVTVVSPHFAAALAARDVLGDASSAGAAHPSGGPGAAVGRRLEHVLTYDRPRVLEAAALLLDRARPQTARPMKRARPDPGPAPQTVPRVSAQELPHLVLRAVSTAGQGIVIADARSPDLPVVYVNEAFQRITGYPEEEVLGRNCRFLQGPATDPSQVQPISRRLLAGRDVHAVLLNHRRDGSAFWNEIRISAVRDIQGAITHYIGTQLDVTGRIDREQRTLYLAYHDELTGLPNRVQVLEHLELELRRARRSGGSVAVVLLDLDGFKGINDRLGHSAGDSALTCVAQRLRSAVRSGDLLGRFGGDEFLVVLGGLPPAGAATSGPGDGPPVDEAVARVREHLHAALDAPTELAGVQVRLRASSGAAVFPRDAAGSAELIALADAAMYRVKGRT